jgi:sensor domain CHASE-containing protein
VGGKSLGAIIGIGIIIWDVWDHQQTKKVERPRLRQAITDYFAEVKRSLLHEPESGVMSVLQAVEGNIIASLR